MPSAVFIRPVRYPFRYPLASPAARAYRSRPISSRTSPSSASSRISWAARSIRLDRSGAVPSRPSMMARRRSRVLSGADTLFIGMLPGAPATTEGPFSCLTSGRVHPNPNFQRLLSGSGVVTGTSGDEARHEGAEESFAPAARVVHELEEAEVVR